MKPRSQALLKKLEAHQNQVMGSYRKTMQKHKARFNTTNK